VELIVIKHTFFVFTYSHTPYITDPVPGVRELRNWVRALSSSLIVLLLLRPSISSARLMRFDGGGDDDDEVKGGAGAGGVLGDMLKLVIT
jgi:hypothetical protein